MVRPGYRLNDSVLLPIFEIPADVAPGFPEGLRGFRRLISDWAIDWGRFIDIDTRDYGSSKEADDNKKTTTPANFKRLQFAYRIDTALVEPLKNLPASVAGNPPPSLALRNLLRGRDFGLPSGQDAAHLLGVPESQILKDEQILIGQGVDEPAKGSQIPIAKVDASFAGKCPLWTYVLAEAMHHEAKLPIPVKGPPRPVSTPQLGPVGGAIVTEVFLGLMFYDDQSYLSTQHQDPAWTPDGTHGYGLKDFVKFALG